jgi:acyl-coenzyme A synthetase/AMP-(fatty) acid ligase
MHSKFLSRFPKNNLNLKSSTKSYILSLNCSEHTGTNYNKYVVRESYDLPDPKYKKFSYAVSQSANLHLMCDTIGERINVLAREKPDYVAYKFCLSQTGITFREVKQRIDEIVQNLLSLGFQKGDRLAIMLPNIPELNLTLLAAASIGVTVVLMNPAYQHVEIDFMIKKTKCKGIVILDNLKTVKHYEILSKICPELMTSTGGVINSKTLPDLRHVIVVNNKLMKDNSESYKGTLPYAQIEKFNSAVQQTPHVDFDDPFVMLFTVNDIYFEYFQAF